jgi:hypothetical protein
MMEDGRPARPNPRWVNRILEQARSLYHLTLGTGLTVTHTLAGRSLALSDPSPAFPARITSGTAGGPYRFRRQARRSEAWIDLAARDDPAVGYQANLQSVSVGRIVTMRDVGLGTEYRFLTPRGPSAGGGDVVYSIQALDCCGGGIPNVTVEITVGGAVVDSGATGLDGVFALTPPRTDFDWTFNKTRYDELSGNVSGGLGTFGGTMNPVTGFHCYAPPGLFCEMLPDTIYASGLFGSLYTEAEFGGPQPFAVEMNFDSSSGGWVGCFVAPLAGLSAPGVTAYDCSGVPVNLILGQCGGLSVIPYSTGLAPQWLCGPCPLPVDFVGPGAGTGITGQECCVPGYEADYTAVYGAGESGTWDISDGLIAGYMGAVTGRICVTVRAPACGGSPGAVQPGQTVQLFNPANATSTPDQTATADSAGQHCFTVSEAGFHRIRVPDPAGGFDERSVLAPACGGDQPVTMEVCFAHVCLTVNVLHAEATETTAPVPRPSTLVTLPGIGTATTDSGGQVCTTLNTAAMKGLPVTAGSSGCNSRDLYAEVTGEGLLKRCFITQVLCGDTAAVGTITVYDRKTSGGLDRYIPLPEALASLCTGPNCFNGGWMGQDVIPYAWAFQVDYFRYQYDLDDLSGTDFYSVLPAAITLTPVTLFLDTERLAGTTPTTFSPFDLTLPAQRVEYQGSYSGSWTSRDGRTYSGGGHVWLSATKAIVSIQDTGVDLMSETPPETLDVPAGLPEGSALSAAVILLHIPLAFNVCDFVGSTASSSIPDALGPGHDLQSLARWTEAPPP